MCNLRNIEFYGTPEGEVMISSSEFPLQKYHVEDRAFTQEMLSLIEEFYPKAFGMLCSIYTPSKLNRMFFEYQIVHRFIRCNFSEYDNTFDIDHLGRFRFEFVSCPLRGECRGHKVICCPEFNSSLTVCENEVMKFFYRGYKSEEIADLLHRSPETIKKHKKNSFIKLDIHSLAEFNNYANANNLYND